MKQKTTNCDFDSKPQSSITDITNENRVPPSRFIGCCGAYCRTCAALREKVCKGCKLGYNQGKRDIGKAKCLMKICCFKDKHLETCADCLEYLKCERIQSFHSKKGYKYGKYKQSIDFIRKEGYSAFLQIADKWSGPYGKLK